MTLEGILGQAAAAEVVDLVVAVAGWPPAPGAESAAGDLVAGEARDPARLVHPAQT
jgi:hypothetical protein